MSRESIVLLLGIVVIFTHQLGIPTDWKTYVYYSSGILLMIIGYTLRRREWLRRIERENGERTSDSFSESEPQSLNMVDDTPRA